MSHTEAGPVDINKLVESMDLDICLGYLSLVNGINGAILYSREGLVMASGEETQQSHFIEAPYFLANFLESQAQCKMLGMGSLDHAVTFVDNRFHLILNLELMDLFFLVVTGTMGSFELFKFRIERGAQAISRLLHQRGYIRS
jgi:predicted regulator of Ras-like GTPase activity (Roadblock/LC7/MglB family)